VVTLLNQPSLLRFNTLLNIPTGATSLKFSYDNMAL
jgi:hypothetical protein